MNADRIEFGKRLAQVRKNKKLKQEDFKELINVPTVQMISSWENGHSFPSAAYLIIIAKKLDISLDYLLLGRQNDMNVHALITYKDLVTSVFDLIDTGLFELDGYPYGSANQHYLTMLKSDDDTISSFKKELESIIGASKSLKPEIFKQAVSDLLDKYDIPLKQKKSKL